LKVPHLGDLGGKKKLTLTRSAFIVLLKVYSRI
jgi:hypothetical protein